VVNCTVEYQNLEAQPRVLGMDRVPAFILNWGPNVVSGDVNKGIRQSLFWRVQGKTEFQPTAKFANSGGDLEKNIPGADWLAVRSAYFVVAFKSQVQGAAGWSRGNPQRFRFGVAVPRCEIAPGGTQVASALLYVGPGQMQHLKNAWPSLDTTVRFFEYPELLNWFAKTLLACLNWFYGIVPNYGVAIILLTVMVRLVMVPLTLKQMRSMKYMQLLAPEMEKLKEKYANEPQQLQAKMWEMYRERGVNPLGGCLPVALQLPVFISLYRMIWSAYELRGAPFALWMTDLSEPDRLLHIPALKVVPYIGEHIQYINVLPIISAVVMVISMKLMPMSTPSPNMQQQQRIMMFMPVFFSLICYSFASGLQLYIITSTIWGIAQSKLMRVHMDQLPEKRQPRKREHFYTAAMRKRQRMAKEAKGNGKRRDVKKKSEAPQRQFPPTWWPF
jgi:YidC/Oxa1 family membrane protein insertase